MAPTRKKGRGSAHTRRSGGKAPRRRRAGREGWRENGARSDSRKAERPPPLMRRSQAGRMARARRLRGQNKPTAAPATVAAHTQPAPSPQAPTRRQGIFKGPRPAPEHFLVTEMDQRNLVRAARAGTDAPGLDMGAPAAAVLAEAAVGRRRNFNGHFRFLSVRGLRGTGLVIQLGVCRTVENVEHHLAATMPAVMQIALLVRHPGVILKIKRISAKNFRTLEDFEIDLGNNYCAISGRNNAGKTSIISIIQYFLDNSDEYRYFPYRGAISYSSDSTQWSEEEKMEISIVVNLNKDEDSELYFFVDKFSPDRLVDDDAIVSITNIWDKDNREELKCTIQGQEVDTQNAREISKKLKNSTNLIIHNSTQNNRSIFYAGAGYAEVLETNFSSEDRKRITEAQTRYQNSVKKAAKQHKEELDKLLGRLNDKFQVELSSLGENPSSKFPLTVKLTDKRVGIALNNWGAGTQNRTRILISVLEAIRMRSAESSDNRTTPVFVVEEPESFLHPSAQAEFGQMLNSIAGELDLQIIATSHSPYMLNQSDPSANFLLERKQFRGIPKETCIIPTDGDSWMLPFAENLGIVPKEFADWAGLFGTNASKVILVEGAIDKEYFEFICENYPSIYAIPKDVEIVVYEGKDALKNTSILQFMLNKFSKVFITFDLDAKREVENALKRIGLRDEADYCAVGVDKAGSDCIEGLIPENITRLSP